jgi:hypothetical protein
MRLPFIDLTRGVVLCLSLLTASLATAGSITFTFMPESSPPYPSGTNGSNSSDPLGPTIGLDVAYRGSGHGGSQETLNGAYLVYRFLLQFDTLVAINNIQMTGWGDNNSGGGNAVMRLLDSNKDVLSTAPLTGWNVPGTWTLDGGGAVGESFYYDEFDYSSVARIRSDLVVNYTVVPEPSSAMICALGLSLILLCAVLHMRRDSSFAV